jgi:hypothetical protein
MSQTIYKMAGKRDPFARIPHTMLDDPAISWRSKGILAYLCGKPDGWKTRATDIRKRGKEGERAVWTALRELRKAGYAELSALRVDGKIREWVWKVADSPIFKSPDGRNEDVGNVDVQNAHHSKKDFNKHHFRKNKSKETKETTPPEIAKVFKAIWTPISGTKEEQLARIEPPTDFPSEYEFDEFIEAEGLDHIAMGKRGDLYADLCDKKWHHWKERRWRPVRDWQAYVRALDTKMAEATECRGRF